MTHSTVSTTESLLLSSLPPEQISRLISAGEQATQTRATRNRLETYRPYTKQAAFHAAGAHHRERLLMAGNQLGKTTCGAAEAAMHLTGAYPDGWRGRRFERPIRMWATSKTSEVTRDGVQRLLIGEPKDTLQWGSGLIPQAALLSTSRRTGVSNALDGATIGHAGGGISTLGFKSYDQGREKWQGETLDVVWFDEEPPLDIYSEGLTRTNATGGIVILTFTPLRGLSDVVRMFLSDSDLGALG
jgi:phage terminase large subunit-like protein